MMPLRKRIPQLLSRRTQLVFLVLTITLMFGSSVVWAKSNHLLTLTNPQPFTEVYFTNPNQLPKKVTAGETDIILFTIASHESQACDYVYRATAYEGTVQRNLGENSFAFNPSQKQIFGVSYTPQQTGQRILLVISVHNKTTNVNQGIQFYLQS